MTHIPLRVLVSGVGGFIGAQVARRILEEGHQVFGVDDFSTGYHENVPEGLELIVHDLAKRDIHESLPEKCDVILHLAGQYSGEMSFDDPVADLEKNAHSTLNLIHYGIAVGARRLVYASSMSVYGNVPDLPVNEKTACRPLTCYGNSKLATERYLSIYQKKLPCVIFRMFNVYGPGQNMANLRQGMVSIFMAQMMKGENVQVKGSLERFRDFIFIDDVVEAWHQTTISDRADGRILNLGTGCRTSVLELLECMAQHFSLATWFTQDQTPGDQLGIYADTSNLCAVLGFDKFTDLKDGLGRFTAWAEDSDQNLNVMDKKRGCPR